MNEDLVIERFRAAMRAHGIVPPERIEADGHIHRCDVDARNGKGDGAYVLHLDGIPAGGFQNWQTGDWQDWCAKDARALTPQERLQLRTTAELSRRQREAESTGRSAETRQRARQLWERATVASADHPYLARKDVPPHGLRMHSGRLTIGSMDCDGALLIPLRDTAGQLDSLQFIGADGEKRYLPGGRVSGCYYGMGKPDGILIIAEGYATAASLHKATSHATACAFNAGNLTPVAKALRVKLPDIRIVIAADNDVSEKTNVGVEKAQEAARAVNGLLAIPELEGRRCDFNDMAQALGAEAVRLAIESATSPPVPSVSCEKPPRPQPRALPDPLPQVPNFDLDLLPDTVRPWVEDHADALQVPPDYLAVAAMVALAGAIGRQVGMSVKQFERWIERPILWACIVGRPSAGKSPALRPSYSMLSRLESEGWADYEHELREYEARQLVAVAAKQNAQKIARKRLEEGNSEAALQAAAAAITEDGEPQQARLIVNDVTVEKIGEILNANPRGLVQFRDELSGWLASLDREGRESDRAFWLECWSGTGPYTSDRIGRGTVRIEACAVSILGGTQPGKFAEYVRACCKGGSGDDGLLPRFQLAIYPDPPKDWRYIDRSPNQAALDACWTVFRRLNALKAEEIGAKRADFVDIPFLHFSPHAQSLFVEWQTALMLRLRQGGEPPFIESHLGKYPALAARLALVIHLAEAGAGPVSAGALGKALDWTVYLERHARRIYAPVTDNGLTAAHMLLAKRSELASGFTLRDLQRKEWAGLDRDSIQSALEWLMEYERLVSIIEETGGRPTTRYQWVPV